MDINININFNGKAVKSIFKQLIQLGEKMATLDERLAALVEVVSATEGKVKSGIVLGQKIFEEVRKLAESQNVNLTGLDELEAKTLALAAEITTAVDNLGEIDAVIPDA
jgi:hypothetical protein